jgi:hypothetical protein
MSVHTLIERDGMVSIAADIRVGEVLDALKTITRFCCKVAGLSEPVVFFPANMTTADIHDTPLGSIGLRSRKVVIDLPDCSGCGDTNTLSLTPGKAQEGAQLLAGYAALAREEPSDEEVVELAQAIRDGNPTAGDIVVLPIPAEALARNLLRAGYGRVERES